MNWLQIRFNPGRLSPALRPVLNSVLPRAAGSCALRLIAGPAQDISHAVLPHVVLSHAVTGEFLDDVGVHRLGIVDIEVAFGDRPGALLGETAAIQ